MSVAHTTAVLRSPVARNMANAEVRLTSSAFVCASVCVCVCVCVCVRVCVCVCVWCASLFSEFTQEFYGTLVCVTKTRAPRPDREPSFPWNKPTCTLVCSSDRVWACVVQTRNSVVIICEIHFHVGSESVSRSTEHLCGISVSGRRTIIEFVVIGIFDEAMFTAAETSSATLSHHRGLLLRIHPSFLLHIHRDLLA